MTIIYRLLINRKPPARVSYEKTFTLEWFFYLPALVKK